MARPSWVGRAKPSGPAEPAIGPGPAVPASGRPDDRLRANGKVVGTALCAFAHPGGKD
jgi:hypothetical protein